jgi:alpha-tubulin suppressor-like RCC1 family protein
MFVDSGLIYVFGDNFKRKLGMPGPDLSSPTLLSGFSSVTQVVAATLYSLFLTEDGSIYGFGETMDGGTCGADKSPPGPAKLQGFLAKKISAGFSHTMFISKDGKVYVCGKNDVFTILLIFKGRPTWYWIQK